MTWRQKFAADLAVRMAELDDREPTEADRQFAARIAAGTSIDEAWTLSAEPLSDEDRERRRIRFTASLPPVTLTIGGELVGSTPERTWPSAFSVEVP